MFGKCWCERQHKAQCRADGILGMLAHRRRVRSSARSICNLHKYLKASPRGGGDVVCRISFQLILPENYIPSWYTCDGGHAASTKTATGDGDDDDVERSKVTERNPQPVNHRKHAHTRCTRACFLRGKLGKSPPTSSSGSSSVVVVASAATLAKPIQALNTRRKLF